MYVCVAGNTYLKLEMNQAEVNDTGILSSPWLNGSAHLSCQLQFRYDVGNDDACQLSVLLRTETTLTSLWASDDTSGTPDIEIPRAERQYQVRYQSTLTRGTRLLHPCFLGINRLCTE